MSEETPDVKYSVKELLAIQNETLNRIEGKVDANALAQAEAMGKLDTRVSLLESQDLDPRIKLLEASRSESQGARDLTRWIWPSVISLASLTVFILGLVFH